jgi:hypothetical protein
MEACNTFANILKKLISILLVLLLVVSTGGVYYLFVIQKAQIERNFKTKLKAGIPESEWILFKFADINEAKTSPKLQWVKSYEFIYKGEFYDIVNETTVNDSLYLYCIHDFKDTKLAARKKKAFGDQPDDRTKFAPTYRVVYNWFFQVLKLLQTEPFFKKTTTQFFYADHLIKLQKPPETPPPQMAVLFQQHLIS